MPGERALRAGLHRLIIGQLSVLSRIDVMDTRPPPIYASPRRITPAPAGVAHAFQRGTRMALPCFVEFFPAVEGARDACRHPRIEAVEFDHLGRAEGIAVGRVKVRRIGAEGADQPFA